MSPFEEDLELGRRLAADVLGAIKEAFVGKDEVIDLLGVSLIAGENLFIMGPPGTAKSALVQELARGLDGRVFDYLLTRFTEPAELFGPFDIRRLRDGELVTNTEGMLPEANFAFLDELLNANSAILNSLLTVLNERVFRRGGESRRLPLVMVVGASNRLPEDDALAALFDRFLLRVHCDNVPDDRLGEVLMAGWRLDFARTRPASRFSIEAVHRLNARLADVDLSAIRGPYMELVKALRRAGIEVSDRRAVKLQRVVAASAITCGRARANQTDLWVLRYIWDTREQQEVIGAIVQASLDKAAEEERAAAHPRAVADRPEPEELARQLDRLAEQGGMPGLSAADRSVLLDRLRLLSSRSAWVAQEQARAHLEKRAADVWKALEEPA
jgi:MoxR-like ATPase